MTTTLQGLQLVGREAPAAPAPSVALDALIAAHEGELSHARFGAVLVIKQSDGAYNVVKVTPQHIDYSRPVLRVKAEHAYAISTLTGDLVSRAEGATRRQVALATAREAASQRGHVPPAAYRVVGYQSNMALLRRVLPGGGVNPFDTACVSAALAGGAATVVFTPTGRT